LNHEKLLNLIQEPILQQATNEQCTEDCSCKSSPNKSRKMSSAEKLEMKEKDLEKAKDGKLAGDEAT